MVCNCGDKSSRRKHISGKEVRKQRSFSLTNVQRQNSLMKFICPQEEIKPPTVNKAAWRLMRFLRTLTSLKAEY